jgi:very-short-patch-repair endonuclease
MDKVIKETARNLRNDLTHAEKLLWERIRLKQIDGLKFRRQQVVGRFIADFICFEKRLIIELDGGVHISQKERDSERDHYLRESGYNIIRFLNEEIEQDIEIVLIRITEYLSGLPVPDLPQKWKRDK